MHVGRSCQGSRASGWQKTAAYSRLTRTEITKLDLLKSWPRPPQMLKPTAIDAYGTPWLKGARLEALHCLHDNSYGPDSRVVHQKDHALYFSTLQG